MGPRTDEDFDDSRAPAVGLRGLMRGAGLGPVTTLAIGGATLIVAIAIGTFIAVMNFRDRALDTSKQQLENTVLILSRAARSEYFFPLLARASMAASARATSGYLSAAENGGVTVAMIEPSIGPPGWRNCLF